MHNWKNKFEDYLSDIAFDDSSHDLNHFRRVWKIAKDISKNEEADEEVLLAASYFHDIVSFPKNDPRRKDSSYHAALKTQEILLEMNFPMEKIEKVKHCIHAHSYSANIVPETIEAKIIQDADRMEAIGAIGLARCFYVSGLMKGNLFHSSDPFAKSRERDDMKYAVDHFYEKLLKLEKKMNTKRGKEIARERTLVLENFLKQLESELIML